MKAILVILSMLALALTVMPSVLVFLQKMSLEEHKQVMVGGMILWFVTAPFWLKEQKL